MATPTRPRRADIDSFYTCRHPEQFQINWRDFYESAEQRTAALRAQWPHELDVAYGPHPQQRLDLYYPPSTTAAPVLLFLHGGGFREGDPALYGFLARPFLERGVLFASVGYRLLPECYLPETARDLEDALAWAHANIAARNGDASRLFLAGHSAGAILAAHVCTRRDWLDARGLPADLVKGVVAISGVYDFRDGAYYIADDTLRAASSPALNVAHPPRHTIIVCGSRENGPRYEAEGLMLADAIRARGGAVDVVRLEGMNHSQTADALGDAGSPLFAPVERLISGIER